MGVVMLSLIVVMFFFAGFVSSIYIIVLGIAALKYFSCLLLKLYFEMVQLI